MVHELDWLTGYAIMRMQLTKGSSATLCHPGFNPLSLLTSLINSSDTFLGVFIESSSCIPSTCAYKEGESVAFMSRPSLEYK